MKKLFSHGELSSLCMELALLLRAGVGVGDALSLLAQEGGGETMAAMARQVDDGATLSAAMRDAGCFPVYVCGLVEVGERSGRTEEALSALSRYYEDRVRTDRRVRSALLYPAVMLLLMLVVIGVLLVRVLPIFDDVYASLGGRLTGVAGGLLSIGRVLDRAMPVLLAVLAVFVLLCAAFAVCEPFRAKLLALWRGSRGDKGVSRRMNNARVAQALAMGMASGLPLEESVELAESLMEDVPAAKGRCTACRMYMDQGMSLGKALGDSGLLPARACRLLEMGARSGAGDAAMDKIARDLSEESQAALEDRISRVEPALVLVCSLLVGLILLSVMLPLMNIMAAIG